MNVGSLHGLWTGLADTELPSSKRGFLCRVSLVAAFVVFAHQLRWEWLRTFTSEVILQVSALLGMATTRISFDTISVNGELFQYVTACTFVDVFMGCIPLVWSQRRSLPGNLLQLMTAAMALLCANLVRLEIGQVLHAQGVSWMLADDVLGGFVYLAVWLAIWRWRRGEWWVHASIPPCVPPGGQAIPSLR